jgi:hypothetical protein
MGCTESKSKLRKAKKSPRVPPVDVLASQSSAKVNARSTTPTRSSKNYLKNSNRSTEGRVKVALENPTNGSNKLLWLVNLKAKEGLKKRKTDDGKYCAFQYQTSVQMCFTVANYSRALSAFCCNCLRTPNK